MFYDKTAMATDRNGKLTIQAVNRLRWRDFVHHFGNVVEKAPLVASAVWAKRPFGAVVDIHRSVVDFLDGMSAEGKEAMLRFIPDLSGDTVRRRQLGDSSLQEQGSTGLFDMTRQKVAILEELNGKYHQKFGFPFVLCCRENKAEAILRELPRRLANGKEEEIVRAVEEVKRISWYRVQDLVRHDDPTSKL